MQKLKPNCGEQLVYIAAFAVAADIVFGDRPKHETYARLLNAANLADLDYAFGVQVLPKHSHHLLNPPSPNSQSKVLQSL